MSGKYTELKNLVHILKDRVSSANVNIVNNISWLFVDRVLKVSLNLLFGILLARYFGAEYFGLIGFAMALVAIFSPVANLGLDNIVVKELVNHEGSENAILGSVFFLKIIGGSIAFSLALATIYLIRPSDKISIYLVFLFGLVFLFKSADIVKLWFEAKVKSKYIVWLESILLLCFFIFKIVMIFMGAGIVFFGWIAVAESVFLAVGYLMLYKKRVGSFFSWNAQYSLCKSLMVQSWPLILSGIAIVLYMRIDQIMLGQMLGNEAVGIYSVAVRFSEAWNFIPIIIVASLFPAIIKVKKINDVMYVKNLQRLYDFLFMLALLIAIVMSFVSVWLVELLLGESYSASGVVLSIHIWASIFVFLGVAGGKWLILEGFQKHLFYRSLFGVASNVALNLILIPLYQEVGAAMATLFSYFLSVFSVGISRKTRPLFFMMVRSLLCINIYKGVFLCLRK
jgi:PST family polysaccharide transporter